MSRRTLLISGSLAALALVIAVVVILRVTTPPTSPASAPNPVLWTLTYLQVGGQTHALVPNAPITMMFHESDHTITGSSGCNSYQATYQQQHAQVHFHDFAVTLMGCLGPNGAQEDLYLQALMGAETLLVSGHDMTITGASGQDVLRFTSASAHQLAPHAGNGA